MKTNRFSYFEDIDSYKSSHWLQYPDNTVSLFSYIESRGGEYDETVFFGLQYYLKEYLSHRVSVEDVEEMNEFMKLHGVPFNYDGWMYIAKDLNGKLPIRIRAVPEGTVVKNHNILVSVETTDPKVFWITSWIETMLLRIWYPITVSTRSHYIKSIIYDALVKSADDPTNEINFKLHDFGSRGVSSQESAMIGGMAHLLNFLGTDTVAGALAAKRYYNIPVAGFSIPASEHSSITSWGKENEIDAYRNMIKQFCKPGNVVACVSDSYDIFNACSKIWGEILKEEIIASGSTLVIRPDSGDPTTVVLKVAQILEEKFGYTVNSKGFKVINNVRIIQGDGINQNSIKDILETLLANNYSASNIAFGMGGGLLQSLNRDTNKFAMKCSQIYRMIDGKKVSIDVFKDPITDHGKKSKAGRLDLRKEIINDNVIYSTIKLPDGVNEDPSGCSAMKTVFENGELIVDDKFEDIRKRLNE